MNFLRLSIFLISFNCSANLFAGEGMWLPYLLGQLNETEMKAMGMKMSAEDIYSVNEGSLKDAIVHFGGFCTAEVISTKGLILTNHHCGYGQIQSHSTLENNYLDDGFWASNHSEELPNKGLFATFILRMEDVTSMVLEGTESLDNQDSIAAKINNNIITIQANYPKYTFESTFIRPFYNGNQFILFLTESYRDVRLVGTPPSSIGKFGSDTDNWVWPRHTGDFALFRIYADKDNLPAEYAVENVPYRPRHSLPISLSGVAPGDFTLVFGFPGRTEQYLPSIAVEQLLENVNPARIKVREQALAILDKHMRSDEATRLKYASKFARIANYWKKWIGESQGLKSSNALQKKYNLEVEFTQRLDTNAIWKPKYGNLLNSFDKYYTIIEKPARSQVYYDEIFLRNIDALIYANRINNSIKAIEKSNESEGEIQIVKIQDYLSTQLKNYSEEVDKEIMTALIKLYIEEIPVEHLAPELRMLKSNPKVIDAFVRDLFRNSTIINKEKFNETLNLDYYAKVNKLREDPLVRFVAEVGDHHENSVQKIINETNVRISVTQKAYTQALLELFPEKKFYPDANGTLRVTYGNVDGYRPKEAVFYEHQTYLDGAIAKYIPGDYEFDMPAKLLELYESKNFGKYAVDGRVPLNFIASNHTTGGNSGSPALDAHGNLIGLNFDRVWEGTMSDINYDESICRNIMVDTRYILFIIDKFADAQNIMDELNIVQPKK